ncbi:MAG: hypothetical protein DBY26_01930 [Amedibacillus dolichus]|uniref:hypothetical protein n=1 Tax=Amedibacillus dolichus TaxID=31971 RepID=UPI000D7A3725|nr:hypothetical protein [Amedibacillus dolichus]PWL68397.1 MAG: hypothetical protein DBY26_01930 [Amedibacillus dolichus]
MKEYIVQEDKGKLLLYTLLNLALTFVLILLSIYTYGNGYFLFAFLGVTGIWFSVKAMCRYGTRLIKNTPVCEFTSDQLILPSLPKEQRTMRYKDIKEIKILRTGFSVKLFFAGEKVTHPSGWSYAGAVYLFKKSKLNEVQKCVMECIKTHHIAYEVVSKA